LMSKTYLKSDHFSSLPKIEARRIFDERRCPR
jgi:hypothetical protein